MVMDPFREGEGVYLCVIMCWYNGTETSSWINRGLRSQVLNAGYNENGFYCNFSEILHFGMVNVYKAKCLYVKTYVCFQHVNVCVRKKTRIIF